MIDTLYYPNLKSESENVCFNYKLRRREVVPVNHFPRNNFASRRPRIQNSVQIRAPHQQEQPAAAVQVPAVAIVQIPEQQFEAVDQPVQASANAPSQSNLAPSQEIEHYKCLLAKRDNEIQIYKTAVKDLIDKLGPEDLTVDLQQYYAGILLSDAEDSNDSSSDVNEAVDDSANKENVGNGVETDMSFSFSHQFYLNVRIYSSHTLFSLVLNRDARFICFL